MGGEEEPWEWGSVRSGALWRYCGTTERSANLCINSVDLFWRRVTEQIVRSW
ncbi:hypothetical protein GEV33_006705 [Tenebrio molitor]|uniref:Uncharacterized protein n=1 Tax=Tenebrio molitor TaxID=7067 RepID=A0A8J6HC45_TENMO|nr:hypothetical protein GEV33_006705 [Tenebrio molitor]